MSQSARLIGFFSEAISKGQPMQDEFDADYCRMPGLYRLWDLPMVLQGDEDWRVHYAQLTEDGTPLFSLYRREAREGTQ